MDVSTLIAVIVFGYFIVDSVLGELQRRRALAYLSTKYPGEKFTYTPVVFTNIPLSIYCWLRYGSPAATWGCDDTREETA